MFSNDLPTGTYNLAKRPPLWWIPTVYWEFKAAPGLLNLLLYLPYGGVLEEEKTRSGLLTSQQFMPLPLALESKNDDNAQLRNRNCWLLMRWYTTMLRWGSVHHRGPVCCFWGSRRGGVSSFWVFLCRFWCSHCVPHCSQHVLSVFSSSSQWLFVMFPIYSSHFSQYHHSLSHILCPKLYSCNQYK